MLNPLKNNITVFKLLAFVSGWLFFAANSFSQNTHAWIDYNLRYFKIPVINDGIYRIDSTTLANAGIDLTQVNPKNFKMYAYGNEIPLYIEGESDNVFNGIDFIEFYAENRNGLFDTLLYGNKKVSPNPYYSLFTDTAYYFLTWDNQINHLRVQPETDLNFSAYTPENYVWRTVVFFLTQTFYPGETDDFGSTDPEFVSSEGFFAYAINKNAQADYNIPTEYPYTSGPAAIAEIAFTGQSDYAQLNPDHHTKVYFGNGFPLMLDTIFEGYRLIKKKFSVSASSLNNLTTTLRMQSVGDLSTQYPNYVDYIALTYFTLQYPFIPTFFGYPLTIEVDDHPSMSKSFVNISNFTGTQAIVWDITNAKRIASQVNGSNLQFLVPNAGNRKKLFVCPAGNIQYVSTLYPVGNNGYFTNYIVPAIDSAYVIISHSALWNEAQNYAAYRTLSGYNTLLCNIDELYDQYAYGIKKHPLSIRFFANHLKSQWGNPAYLFLLGKGIKYNDFRNNATNFHKCLIPTYGYPGSDIRLTSGLGGQPWQPVMATGRLAASTPQHVNDYLNKVMQYEATAPNEEWKKNILHFAGGTDINQSNWFLTYLNAFRLILEDTSFGGHVTTFQKTVSVPIQTSLADSIKQLIKKGASIMTFFGHGSAGGGFDQNIDDPSTWDNSGKYPFLVGNACYTGDIFLSSSGSISEQYTLIPNEGVIGFLSTVDLGLTSYLFDYSYELFMQLGRKNYGKPIGVCIKEDILTQQIINSNDKYRRAVAWGMILHGDPGLVIASPDLPDYMISADRVYFTPELLSTETDSFTINIIITNLGKAINQPLTIEIKRKFPNQAKPDTIYVQTIQAPYFKDTFSLKLPTDFVYGVGLNYFEISVDGSNLIPELDETNNYILLPKEIRSGLIHPVYPYNYAIVPNQGIKLIASTGNPFEQNRMYVFELDTTDTYDSPLKQTYKLASIGGIIEWKPSLLQNMPDSQVYFWRVSPDSVYFGEYIWKEFSFQYIPGKRGWSQDHFFQFKNNQFTYLNFNRPQRKFEFFNTVRNLYCQNIGNPTTFSALYNILWKIDFELQDYAVCGFPPSIHVAVIDSLDLTAWGTYACKPGDPNPCGSCIMENANHQFGNANNGCNQCRARVEKYFIFRVFDSAQMLAMRDMINNAVPNGNYLLVYSVFNPLFSQWDAIDPSIKQALVNLGATKIQPANDSLPYIFFTQKGNNASTIEIIGQTKYDTITLQTPIAGKAGFGLMKSELIGMAARWDSLFIDFHSTESSVSDSILIKIIGIDASMNETTLLSQLYANDVKMELNSWINAQQYPYLKLEAYFKDDLYKTAPQLDYWMITYEPVPEAALAPNFYFTFHKDTLQEGEIMKCSVAVKNISEFDMDSLLISYKILDRNNQIHAIPYPRQKPLPADSILISSVEWNTYGYPFANKLLIMVNPNYDQPEQYLFNNYGEIPFYVNTDKQNPLLDVTFDGIRILDGDIVSAKPTIEITLKDENPFLTLDDTSAFEIYLKKPGSTSFQRIYFRNSNGSEIMQFTPGNPPKNKAKITWPARFDQDGIYTLRVQAADKSNNKAGSADYTIDFEVINKPSITQVLNYPNPFSTSTRFVFVLTGSEIPDVFKIQILTITGKVVREIDKDELGPIRIGRNITEFAWDGTDQFGDRLANGVYLYRVITQLNGQSIELRNSSADQYFTKGFGKMYLFR